jgi:hypothetical protein
MDVSADGSVPPHLLERLRQLEAPPTSSSPASGDLSGNAQRPSAAARRRTQPPRNGGSSRPSAGDPEQELYTAFQQLLLEDGD